MPLSSVDPASYPSYHALLGYCSGPFLGESPERYGVRCLRGAYLLGRITLEEFEEHIGGLLRQLAPDG